MAQHQKEKGMEIDLSGHRNPEQFLKEMQARFPDSNISLTLEGKVLYVNPSEQLPLQIMVNAYESLLAQAKYAMYGPGAR